MSTDLTLVWFKRDLRIRDHEPLRQAAARGPCICLYIYEPEVVSADDFDPLHLAFINDALDELDRSLRALGGRLVTRIGEAVSVLETLRRDYGFTRMLSHEETGNRITYDRDIRVKRWAKTQGVEWTEIPQYGVIRGLKSRNGWAARWNKMMRGPIAAAPTRVLTLDEIFSEGRVDGVRMGLGPVTQSWRQPAGEAAALETLRSFLTDRGERYQSEMSAPATAWNSCSRLSPYFAYGNLSMKTAFQTLEAQRTKCRERKRAGKNIGPDWLKSLSSFDKRLHWHCHFMQKLESQPSLEFRNMARVYDGLRENHFDPDRFEAWCTGRTGYPMVDACMRQLVATGWLNFRMRAMLVSFASYHLWLHWRETGLFLARRFLDYEPGIHYNQLQMQSGVTGINSVRIYSPTKQVLDHDPEGHYIRRWVPELGGVPAEHIAQPSLMTRDEQSRYGCIIGQDYPAPIVDHKAAVSAAKSRIYAVRRRGESRAQAQMVFQRHGSRRRPANRAPRRTSPSA